MKFALFRRLLAVLVALVIWPLTAFAYEPPRAGLMIDVASNKALYEEEADALRHPASLTKMMTVYMIFEALSAGKITLETPVVASRHSADRAPSRLGHAKGEIISVDLAIDALIVRSANDVAAAVAELLAETEEQFAATMTVRARQLGMKNTVYRNASGLPNKEQVTTARDQAILGLALKRDFPQYYHRFAARTVSYKERTWNTHNNLLKKYDAVSGIKTGFINASGFNIVTYAHLPEGDRIIVVMGGRSAKERDQVAIDLMEGRTPFHRLNEDDQQLRIAEMAKRKEDEKKRLAQQEEQERARAVVEKEKPETEFTVAAIPDDAPEAQPEANEISPYAIQVGALPTRERASERLALARPFLADENLRQYTLALQTSNGEVYRARIIGFSNMKAAFEACDVMEEKQIECMALIQK